MVSESVPALLYSLVVRGGIFVNAVFFPNIDVEYNRAQNIYKGRCKLQNMNRSAELYENNNHYGIEYNCADLQKRSDISALICLNKDGISHSEIVLGKCAQRNYQDKSGSKHPVEVLVDEDGENTCKHNGVSYEYECDSPKELLRCNNDTADCRAVVVGKRLVQRSSDNSADTCLNKGNVAEKLSYGGGERVDVRTVGADNKSRYNESADNTDKFKQQRCRRVQ